MSTSGTIKVMASTQLEVGPGWVDVIEPHEMSGGTIRGSTPDELDRLCAKLKVAAALLRTREALQQQDRPTELYDLSD